MNLISSSLVKELGDFWGWLVEKGYYKCLNELEVEFVERLDRKGHNSASRHLNINNNHRWAI